MMQSWYSLVDLVQENIQLRLLKLCQNKKGQMFVGMLVFYPFFNQLPAAKKGFKKQVSLQTFGPLCFVRALI